MGREAWVDANSKSGMIGESDAEGRDQRERERVVRQYERDGRYESKGECGDNFSSIVSDTVIERYA